MGLIFLYEVRLVPNANPRKRNDEFSHALARFFQTIGLNYLMSGQGGAGTTRGIAHRKEGDATQQDRERGVNSSASNPSRQLPGLEIWNRTPSLRITFAQSRSGRSRSNTLRMLSGPRPPPTTRRFD